jgi:protein SCO1/2
MTKRFSIKTRAIKRASLFLIAAFGLLIPSAFGQGNWGASGPPMASPPSSGKPKMLENVGIEQRLGDQLPLDLVFSDENDQTVKLVDYFGSKPVIIALVYYSCPQLCNQVLNGLTSSLKTLTAFDIGKEFTVLTVSFDPRETPQLAAQKKATYIDWYKRNGAADGWHFLTGDQEAIYRITDAVGFHYNYDPKTDQFAHASGIIIATPQGKLARYFYGVEYSASDLRLGLIEASENKIGTPVDKLILYCFHYDPASGKYGPVVVNMIRLGGVVTILGMVALLLVMRRKNQTRRSEVGGAF